MRLARLALTGWKIPCAQSFFRMIGEIAAWMDESISSAICSRAAHHRGVVGSACALHDQVAEGVDLPAFINGSATVVVSDYSITAGPQRCAAQVAA